MPERDLGESPDDQQADYADEEIGRDRECRT
jgi:hypothetical protein